MPEMKGRSLEELDEIFEAGVPARKFPQYQCRILEGAKQELSAHGLEIAKPGATVTERAGREV
jgi:hypothetical protein